MNKNMVKNGTVTEVTLEGRLDANSAPEAESYLLEAAKDCEKLSLDLGALVYISSAGLRVMKVVHNTMKKQGGALVLKNVDPKVMEVFNVTGFASLLQFE